MSRTTFPARRRTRGTGNYFFFRFFFAFAALALLVVGCRFWPALEAAALLGRGPAARMSRRASSKLGG